jgi:hypothetical protein
MQEQHLFEYAVIRVVPHVEREEFINVGVVLFCGKQKFLQAQFHLDEKKLQALCHKIDLQEIGDHITAFQKVCEGGQSAGPIGALSLAERFRWLTATRSTVLQPSKVHPGLCDNPQVMLDRLFTQMVL